MEVFQMNEEFIQKFSEVVKKILGSGKVRRIGPISQTESAELCWYILQVAKHKIALCDNIIHNSEQETVFEEIGEGKTSVNNLGLLMIGWYSDDTIDDLKAFWPTVGKGKLGNVVSSVFTLKEKDCDKLDREGGPFNFFTLGEIKRFRGTIDELIKFSKLYHESKLETEKRLEEIGRCNPVPPVGRHNVLINTRDTRV